MQKCLNAKRKHLTPADFAAPCWNLEKCTKNKSAPGTIKYVRENT